MVSLIRFRATPPCFFLLSLDSPPSHILAFFRCSFTGPGERLSAYAFVNPADSRDSPPDCSPFPSSGRGKAYPVPCNFCVVKALPNGHSSVIPAAFPSILRPCPLPVCDLIVGSLGPRPTQAFRFPEILPVEPHTPTKNPTKQQNPNKTPTKHNRTPTKNFTPPPKTKQHHPSTKQNQTPPPNTSPKNTPHQTKPHYPHHQNPPHRTTPQPPPPIHKTPITT